MLSETTSLEVEKINQQVYDLFEGMDVEGYLDYGRITEYRKILLVSNICESVSEINPILFHPSTEGVFNFPVSIFRKIISLCKNRQDFIKIAQLGIIERVLYSEDYYVFGMMLGFISSIDELENLSEDEDFIYLCIYIKNCNIVKRVLEFYDVKIIDDIIKIFNSGKWEHLKKIMRNGDMTELEEVLFLNPEQSSTIPDNIIFFDKTLKVGACSDAEFFNLLILNERKVTSYISITYGGAIIGYIKQVGVPSFLALRDVFTESGILVLRKGMIYALNHAEEIYEEFEVSSGTQIQVNPIRMLYTRDLNEYIQGFLSHVE